MEKSEAAVRRENTRLRRQVEFYKARHDFAIERLGRLADNLGNRREGIAESWDRCMQRLAIHALERLAGMPLDTKEY